VIEGTGRCTSGDRAGLVAPAYGSLTEAVCQCRPAKDEGFLPAHTCDRLYGDAEGIGRALGGRRVYPSRPMDQSRVVGGRGPAGGQAGAVREPAHERYIASGGTSREGPATPSASPVWSASLDFGASTLDSSNE